MKDDRKEIVERLRSHCKANAKRLQDDFKEISIDWEANAKDCNRKTSAKRLSNDRVAKKIKGSL
jgi:hypothetical protein